MTLGDPTKIQASLDPMTYEMSGVTQHGNKYFRVPLISQITDDLYQGGCFNMAVLPEVIEHVVSLYPWEKYQVPPKQPIASYLEVKMYDSLEQSQDQVEVLAQWVNNCRKQGPTLVHCQAGLNRSSLVAARALMLDGMTADEAITLLRDKRSQACLCNDSFEKYLRSL